MKTDLANRVANRAVPSTQFQQHVAILSGLRAIKVEVLVAISTEVAALVVHFKSNEGHVKLVGSRIWSEILVEPAGL